MKIKRLWVSEYKNLRTTEFIFKSDLVTLLVGNNGLGKSNLIEVFLLLFVELRSFSNEEEMKDWVSENFQFILEYEIFALDVKIELLKNDNNQVKPTFFVSESNVVKELNFSEFKKSRNELLPQQVIVYYSGENKRLFKISENFLEKESKHLLQQARSEKETDNEIRKVFISENRHSPLILLTLSVFGNRGPEYIHFRKLLEDYLSIERIEEFSIRFNNPDWNFEDLGGINRGMDYLLSNVQDDVSRPFWNLAGKIDQLITRFYNYDIERGRNPIYYPPDEETAKAFEREILEFRDVNIKKFSEALSQVFLEPTQFFDALESITFLNVLKDLKFKIKKKGIDKLLEYHDLSEGEQQLLTTIGLLILFSNRQSIFLLDEPDTHLNPNWQRDFIHLLEYFNQEKLNNQIVIATHSPLIVQSSKGADVFLFKQDGERILIDSEVPHIHNWRIDQVLLSPYFSIENSRPYSTDAFIQKRKELISKAELSEDDMVLLESYKNELGYLPTGETLEEVQDKILLRQEANRIRNMT